jgi:hypothetical protein
MNSNKARATPKAAEVEKMDELRIDIDSTLLSSRS